MLNTVLMLNALGGWLAGQLWRMSLELAILAVIVYGVLLVLRVKSPAMRHLFWCLVLAKPVAVFLVASPVSLYWFLQPAPPPVTGVSVTASAPAPAYRPGPRSYRPMRTPGPAPRVEPQVETPSPWRSLNRHGVLAMAWLGVAGILAARLIAGCAYVAFLRQTATVQRDGHLHAALLEAARALSVTRRVDIGLSPVAHGPALAGILRPMILLPEALLKSLGTDRLRLVIAHELAHVKRHDNLLLLVQRLAEVLFFFHPVVWICGRVMRREADAACDDRVLHAYDDHAGYAESLAQVAELRWGISQRVLVNTFAADETNLSRRVRRILNGRTRRMTLGFTALSLVALAIIALVGLPTAAERKAKPSSGEKTAMTADIDYEELEITGHPGANDTFAMVMTSVAALFGKTTDYETMLVLSGEAFAPGIDTEEACPGKWNRRGAEHGLALIGEHLGLSVEPLDLPPRPEWQGDLDRTRPVWEAQRKACAPVLRKHLDDGAVLVCESGWEWRPPEYTDSYATWGVILKAPSDGDIRGACVSGRKDCPMWWVGKTWAIRPNGPMSEPEETLKAALRLGLHRLRSDAAPFDTDDRLFGLDAMERWATQFETVPFCEECGPSSPGCPLSNSLSLWDGATHLASYLRGHAEVAPESARDDLAATAVCYKRVADRMAPYTSWEDGYAPIMGDASRQTDHKDVLAACREDLAEAAGHLEAALKTMGVNVAGQPTTRTVRQGSRSSRILAGVPMVGWWEAVRNRDDAPAGPEDVPFPSCMRAVLQYLGDHDGYATKWIDLPPSHPQHPGTDARTDKTWVYLMATSGAAFQMTWGSDWQTDNMLLRYAANDPDAPYRNAFAAIGYPLEIVSKEPGRDNETIFRQHIVERIDQGVPVLAEGVVGPAEVCTITGYADGGEELLGWSFFQNEDRFTKDIAIEPNGYFRKSGWFEDTHRLLLMGPKQSRPSFSSVATETLRRAAAMARTPYYPTHGPNRANGLAAYTAWANALLDDEAFATEDTARLQTMHEAHMLTSGIIAEGRYYGSWFLQLIVDSGIDPDAKKLLDEAAAAYKKQHDLIWDLWAVIPFSDTADDLLRLRDRTVRKQAADIILAMRAEEERAVQSIEAYLRSIGVAPAPIPVERSTDETDATTTARSGQNVIAGVPIPKWGEGEDNTVMGALKAVLDTMGENYSYAYLMGVSGAAFKIQVSEEGWCPSSPHACVGFDNLTPAVDAIGYPLDYIVVKEGDAEGAERRRQAIVESIDRGCPVLYSHEECGIIAGYKDDGATFLYRPYMNQDADYAELTEFSWAGAGVFGEKGTLLPRRDAIIEGLKLAVRQARLGAIRDPEIGSVYRGGFNAYERWIEELEDKAFLPSLSEESRSGSQIGNAWIMVCLIDARAAATRFLRDAAAVFDAPVSERIEQAAVEYQAVYDALEPARLLAPFPWDGREWTREMRSAQAAALRTALAHERRAIRAIDEALAELDVEVEPVDTMENGVMNSNHNVITEVPSLAWGQGKDCTYIGALEAALAVTPHPWAYDDLMGVSGLAFRVRWYHGDTGQRWCPSSAVGEFPEEGAALARATGWPLPTEVAPEEAPHMERFRDRIVAAIDAGQPVLGYEPGLNMATIFGYKEGGDIVLLRDYMTQGDVLELPIEQLGFILMFLGEHGTAPSRRDNLVAALRMAVTHGDREPLPAERGEYWYGADGYNRWMGDIEAAGQLGAEEQAALLGPSTFNFATLLDARAAASRFLRKHADLLGEDGREALLRAAEIYERGLAELRQARSGRVAFTGSADDWNAPARQQDREALAQAKQMDAAALAEIRAALSSE